MVSFFRFSFSARSRARKKKPPPQIRKKKPSLLLTHLQVLRDLPDVESRPELLPVPRDRLHLHQVDHAREPFLGPDRKRQHQRVGAEVALDHLDGAEKVGAHAVHLVDEADARHAVLVRLAPDGLGLGLDSPHRVEQRDGAVEDAEGALDLEGEVDVAGRVDDVDAVARPLAGGRGRGDGDAALLLLLHPVHGGGTY